MRKSRNACVLLLPSDSHKPMFVLPQAALAPTPWVPRAFGWPREGIHSDSFHRKYSLCALLSGMARLASRVSGNTASVSV